MEHLRGDCGPSREPDPPAFPSLAQVPCKRHGIPLAPSRWGDLPTTKRPGHPVVTHPRLPGDGHPSDHLAVAEALDFLPGVAVRQQDLLCVLAMLRRRRLHASGSPRKLEGDPDLFDPSP